MKSFTDRAVPAEFSVFGIRDLDGLLYVAYARTKGGDGGFIDIFSESAVLLKTLAKESTAEPAVGIRRRPQRLRSNTLLVSNNTNSGTINAFNAITGAFVSSMRDKSDKVITVDQLWSIDFGYGMPNTNNRPANELFFTAGPNNNLNGTFGSIVFK